MGKGQSCVVAHGVCVGYTHNTGLPVPQHLALSNGSGFSFSAALSVDV